MERNGLSPSEMVFLKTQGNFMPPRVNLNLNAGLIFSVCNADSYGRSKLQFKNRFFQSPKCEQLAPFTSLIHFLYHHLKIEKKNSSHTERAPCSIAPPPRTAVIDIFAPSAPIFIFGSSCKNPQRWVRGTDYDNNTASRSD